MYTFDRTDVWSKHSIMRKSFQPFDNPLGQKGEKCFMELSEKQRKALKRSNAENREITREAIQGALFQLLERMPYAEIRPTDIIRRAGVSRSSFYHNYRSKDDIIIERLDLPIRSFRDCLSDDLGESWEKLFDLVRQNQSSLLALEQAGLSSVLLDRMNELLPDTEDKYRMALWYGMIYNAIIVWLRGGMREEPKELSAIIVAGMDHLWKTNK